jgi:hypothetical protein
VGRGGAAAGGRLEGLARRGRTAAERPLRRRLALRAACWRNDHEAPSPNCECGIHAGRELSAWSHYLAVGAESRVFGRVFLWGSTVEGAHAWRAALARPAEIFVPPAVTDRRDVADALQAYGVPVHVLEPVEEAVPV